jgi:hypothetical protein
MVFAISSMFMVEVGWAKFGWKKMSDELDGGDDDDDEEELMVMVMLCWCCWFIFLGSL